MAQINEGAELPDVAPRTSGIAVQATPDQAGALKAQALQRLGTAADQAGKFYGQVAANDANNRFTDAAYQIRTKMMSLRGADAIANAGPAQEELNQAYQDIREGLYTTDSQLQFDQYSRRFRAYVQQDIGGYADQQQKVWAKDTNDQKIQTNANIAGSSAVSGDDRMRATALNGMIDGYVKNEQLVRGFNDPEAATIGKQKADQHFAQVQIQALLATPGRAQDAQTILDANRSVLAGLPEYGTLARQVKDGVINQRMAPAIDSAVNDALGNARSQIANPTGISEADAGAVVDRLFPGAVITSQQRSPGHNAAVGGVPDSMHLNGSALDFVAPKGTSLDQIKASLAAQGLPVSELIDEGTHIHWGWGQKGGPAQGQTYPSLADAISANMEKSLQKAQTDAENLFPDYPDAQERYVESFQRRLNQTVVQQHQMYEVGTHVVQQAMEQHHPISEEQLEAISPEVAEAWHTTQVNNPMVALSVNRMFDANARGKAKTYGTQFNMVMENILAPDGTPGRINNSYDLWNYVDPNAGEHSPLTNTGVNALSSVLAIRSGPNGETNAEAIKGFVERLHDQLTFSKQYYGLSDPKGEQLYEKSLQNILPALATGLKNGKTVAEMTDPAPANKDYVGRLAMAPRSVDKRMADIMAATETMILPESGNKPQTLDARKGAMVDAAVKSGQMSQEKGNELKALMLDNQIGKLTAAQARQKSMALGIFPPDVPKPE